jgi:hypothetical protein
MKMVQVSSGYEKIKNRCAKVISINLWAWLYLERVKELATKAKENGWDDKGIMEHKTEDGTKVDSPTWWDPIKRHYYYILVTSPQYHPHVYHWMKPQSMRDIPFAGIDIMPNPPFGEREILKRFPIKRATFYSGLKKLKKSKYGIKLMSMMDGKIRRKTRYIEFKNLRPLSEIVFIKDKTPEEIDGLITKGYSPKIEYFEHAGKKIIIDLASLDALVRPPNQRTIQIPLNLLTRKNLTTAERLVAVDLYRRTRGDFAWKGNRHLIKKVGNKFYIILFGSGKKVTQEELANKIGVHKSTIKNTLEKLHGTKYI